MTFQKLNSYYQIMSFYLQTNSLLLSETEKMTITFATCLKNIYFLDR